MRLVPILFIVLSLQILASSVRAETASGDGWVLTTTNEDGSERVSGRYVWPEPLYVRVENTGDKDRVENLSAIFSDSAIRVRRVEMLKDVSFDVSEVTEKCIVSNITTNTTSFFDNCTSTWKVKTVSATQWVPVSVTGVPAKKAFDSEMSSYKSKTVYFLRYLWEAPLRVVAKLDYLIGSLKLDPAVNANYSFFSVVTANDSLNSSTPAGAVTNITFPLRLDNVTALFNTGKIMANCSDLVVNDTSGALDCELKGNACRGGFTPNDTLYAFCRVPSYPAGTYSLQWNYGNNLSSNRSQTGAAAWPNSTIALVFGESANINSTAGVKDSSGAANHAGVYDGAAAPMRYVNGSLGGAWSFDPTTSVKRHICAPDSATLDATGGFDTWVLVGNHTGDCTTNHRIWEKYSTTGYIIDVALAGCNVGVQADAGYNGSVGVGLNALGWNNGSKFMLAVTNNQGTFRTYFNGVLVSQPVIVGNITGSLGVWRFGNYASAATACSTDPALDKQYRGDVDFVAQYDEAWSADEVAAWYKHYLTYANGQEQSANTAPNLSVINVTLLNITGSSNNTVAQWNVTWKVSDPDGNSTISACWLDTSAGRSAATFTSANMNCSVIVNLTADTSTRTFTPSVNDSSNSAVLGTNYTSVRIALNRYLSNSSQTHNSTRQVFAQQWNVTNGVAFAYSSIPFSRNSTDFGRTISLPSSGLYMDNLTGKTLDIVAENASFNLQGQTEFQLLINGSTDEPVYNISNGWVLNNTLGVPVNGFTFTFEAPDMVNSTNVRVANGSGLTAYSDVSFTSNVNNVTFTTPDLQASTNWTYRFMSNVQIAQVANHSHAVGVPAGSNSRFRYGPVITTTYNISGSRAIWHLNASTYLPQWASRFDDTYTVTRYPSTGISVTSAYNSSTDILSLNFTPSESQYGVRVQYDVPGVSPLVLAGGGGGGGGTEQQLVVLGNFSVDVSRVDSYHFVSPRGDVKQSLWKFAFSPNRVVRTCGVSEPFDCEVREDGVVVVTRDFTADGVRGRNTLAYLEAGEMSLTDSFGNTVRVGIRVRVINLAWWVSMPFVSSLPASTLFFHVAEGVASGVKVLWLALSGVGLALLFRRR